MTYVELKQRNGQRGGDSLLRPGTKEFQRAFAHFKIDAESPETEKILGQRVDTAFWFFDGCWVQWQEMDLDSLPGPVAYVLFEAAMTHGLGVAEHWKRDTKDLELIPRVLRLTELLRRRYKVHPNWVEHKHRYMNRVTRVKKRAEKWAQELAS